MDRFTQLTGVAAPMPAINIDTDKIIPKTYLKTIGRAGLGRHLFAELRYRRDGSEDPDFVLNRPAYRRAKILIAYDNFGCGSSREHAPWALKDFGITCVIAPSFSDIFAENCYKNAMLPLALPRAICEQLIADAAKGANATLTIDLAAQTVTRPDGEVVRFEIDGFRKRRLLDGLDEIGVTLTKETAITGYEARRAHAQPWLAPAAPDYSVVDQTSAMRASALSQNV
ncbi:MAG: 3-isopropylmalate dehydratase small subunit [Proteobacteria bacterium]|nr:3-isopropylmalate dehydratase small subunit [Pseudomonadota bacterium]